MSTTCQNTDTKEVKKYPYNLLSKDGKLSCCFLFYTKRLFPIQIINAVLIMDIFSFAIHFWIGTCMLFMSGGSLLYSGTGLYIFIVSLPAGVITSYIYKKFQNLYDEGKASSRLMCWYWVRLAQYFIQWLISICIVVFCVIEGIKSIEYTIDRQDRYDDLDDNDNQFGRMRNLLEYKEGDIKYSRTLGGYEQRIIAAFQGFMICGTMFTLYSYLILGGRFLWLAWNKMQSDKGKEFEYQKKIELV